MSDLHFHGIWRMDWGLGNPNKTAALIALLMVAIWGLGYIRKWGFWAALLPFTGLGVCLIHTMSRGGLIALFAGLVPLIITAPRPWPRNRVIALVMVSWIIIGTSVYLNAHLRYEQGLFQEDHSITNRFQIWKTAPRMMADAPGGWGLGNSGDAYMQWYQPLSSKEGYRTLVNSHFTWLVEMGWPLRLAYLFGWGVVLQLCWPGREARWFALPLGIWITLAVAAAFSSVAESPFLWIVPLVGLLVVLVCRIRMNQWPSWHQWLLLATGSIGLYGLILLSGLHQPSLVHRSEATLVFGNESPTLWILPDEKILGKMMGREIRRKTKDEFGETPSTLGVILDPAHLPSLKDCAVMVVGRPASSEVLKHVFQNASSILLVNPKFLPQEVSMRTAHPPLELVLGEFSESSPAMEWEKIATPRMLQGVGDYVPNWTSLLKPVHKESAKSL